MMTRINAKIDKHFISILLDKKRLKGTLRDQLVLATILKKEVPFVIIFLNN